MIRWLIAVVIVIALFIFLASLGSGLGYAQGGGEVRIFSSWSEAHSQTGQAVAIYGDDANVVAANTPSSPERARGYSTSDQIIMLFSIFGLIAVGAFFGWLHYLNHHIDDEHNEYL